MPRLNSFTQSAISGAKKPGDYTFTNISGLELRVTKAGQKSWRWRGRIKDKERKSGRSPRCSISLGELVTENGKPSGLPKKSEFIKVKLKAEAFAESAKEGKHPLEVERKAAADERKEKDEALTVEDLWGFYRQPGGALSTLSERAPQEAASIWRNHLKEPFAERVAASITSQEVKAFYRDKPKRGRSADKHLALLSNIMREGLERDAFERNPCMGAGDAIRGHKARKETTKAAIPSQDDLARIMSMAYDTNHLYGLLVEFAASTGLRQSPTLACRWEWLKSPEGDRSATVTVPAKYMKSGSEHVLPINPSLWRKLDAWRTRDGIQRLSGWVFPSPQTTDESAHIAKPRRWWRKILNEVGLPTANWHSLRKYAATEMARAGVPVHVAKDVLDHADITTTMLYFADANDGDKINALDALAATIPEISTETKQETVVPLRPNSAT